MIDGKEMILQKKILKKREKTDGGERNDEAAIC